MPPASLTRAMFQTPGPDGVTPLFGAPLRFTLEVLVQKSSGPAALKVLTTHNFSNPRPGHQCEVTATAPP